MKMVYLALTILVLSACGGGGSGSPDAATYDTGGSVNDPGSPGAITAEYHMTCQSSADIELVGCWRSDECLYSSTDSLGTSYWIAYVASVRANLDMTQHVQTFTNADCAGAPAQQYDQPFMSNLDILEAFVSDEGLSSHYLAVNWVVGNMTGTGYTGYYIANSNRLCFTGNNYQWTSQGGGISSPATATEQIMTSIGLVHCLDRT